MEKILENFIGEILIQAPTHYKTLSVFPIVLPEKLIPQIPPRSYGLLENSVVGKKQLYIYEPPKNMQQWWEWLHIQNNLRQNIFLPEGILLEGGRQNRILGKSYLLPKKRLFGKKFSLNTYCIERLRSTGRRHDHFEIRGFAPVHIRALGGDSSPHRPQRQKQVWDSVSHSLSLTGISVGVHPTSDVPMAPAGRGNDQTSFVSLHDIQNTLLAMQAEIPEGQQPSRMRFSRTEDLMEIFRDEVNAGLIAKALSNFQPIQNQIGAVAVMKEGKKKLCFIDIFGHPTVFETFHKELFSSYVISEHIFRSQDISLKHEPVAEGVELAQNLLFSLKNPYLEKSNQSFVGKNFRIIDSQIEASGHLDGKNLLYLRASNYQTSFIELTLSRGITLVGRQLKEQVQNENARYFQVEDPLVSRQHGRFEYDGSKCTFRDLRSTNGSEILLQGNFQKVKNPVEVREGTLLRLGDTFIKIKF